MVNSKCAEGAYASKNNIVYPGTQAQADAAEVLARTCWHDEIPGASTGTYATLTTALTGTNNDMVLLARNPGTGGNAITLALVVSGTSTALAVTVSTNAISVAVATNGGGTATSTANDIIAAINAHATASTLVVAELAPSNDGTGVVTALSATNLAGGSATNPSLNVVQRQLTITPGA